MSDTPTTAQEPPPQEPVDPAAAAQARDEIEEQTNVLLLAALAWVALHGDDEPDGDSAVARAAKTLALKVLRATRRMFRTPPKLPTGTARTEWVNRQAKEITQRALEDTRSHYSTVHKREVDRAKRAADSRPARAEDSGDRTRETSEVRARRAIKAVFADDRPWAEAAARTTATRLAAETAIDMLPDVERETGEPHSKLWISRGDPKVRKTHRLLHGKVHELGGAFKEWPDGKSLSYPGDPKAPLDETINCRCALFLVPTSEKEAAEKTFAVDAEDFDVPEGVAASSGPVWLRERAQREWLYELGMRSS